MIGYYNGTGDNTGSCATAGWTIDERSPAASASLVEISALINVAGANRCSANTASGTCPSWDVAPTAGLKMFMSFSYSINTAK